jgi:hypothetical protein
MSSSCNRGARVRLFNYLMECFKLYIKLLMCCAICSFYLANHLLGFLIFIS